jgi:hypothetical protein
LAIWTRVLVSDENGGMKEPTVRTERINRPTIESVGPASSGTSADSGLMPLPQFVIVMMVIDKIYLD